MFKTQCRKTVCRFDPDFTNEKSTLKGLRCRACEDLQTLSREGRGLSGLNFSMVLLVLSIAAMGLFAAPSYALVQETFISAPSQGTRTGPSERAGLSSCVFKDRTSTRLGGKSRAPEPPTMLLFVAGVVGTIVRFAQSSFCICKRIMNHVLAVLALAIAAPFLLLIALLVRVTSQGPVFYCQERVGMCGKKFLMFKFRTMAVDAEKDLGAVWARKNDPRVTIIGALLRKTHLDELPQFFNVLRGEMNIVGPRPERPEIVRDLRKRIAGYDKRLEILPGITGLAQVRQRADESLDDVRRKIRYDLFYIRKMCWLMEVRILASTAFLMLTGKRLSFASSRPAQSKINLNASDRFSF